MGSLSRPQGLGSLCCLWGPLRWHCDVADSERGSGGNWGGRHSLTLHRPGSSHPSGLGGLVHAFAAVFATMLISESAGPVSGPR